MDVGLPVGEEHYSFAPKMFMEHFAEPLGCPCPCVLRVPGFGSQLCCELLDVMKKRLELGAVAFPANERSQLGTKASPG